MAVKQISFDESARKSLLEGEGTMRQGRLTQAGVVEPNPKGPV